MKKLRREVLLPPGSNRGIRYAIACVIAVMGMAAVDAGYQLAQIERQSQVEMAQAAARVQRAARIAEARRANERARRAHVERMSRHHGEGGDAAECPFASQRDK